MNASFYRCPLKSELVVIGDDHSLQCRLKGENMKYFFVLMLAGCTQSPDFSNPVEVMQKSTTDGVSTYMLRDTQGMRHEVFGPVEFSAPQTFANVGDIIVFHRGALRIKKDDWVN